MPKKSQDLPPPSLWSIWYLFLGKLCYISSGILKQPLGNWIVTPEKVWMKYDFYYSAASNDIINSNTLISE